MFISTSCFCPLLSRCRVLHYVTSCVGMSWGGGSGVGLIACVPSEQHHVSGTRSFTKLGYAAPAQNWVYAAPAKAVPKHLLKIAGTQRIDRHRKALKSFIGISFLRKCKTRSGVTILNLEMKNLVFQWMYRKNKKIKTCEEMFKMLCELCKKLKKEKTLQMWVVRTHFQNLQMKPEQQWPVVQWNQTSESSKNRRTSARRVPTVVVSSMVEQDLPCCQWLQHTPDPPNTQVNCKSLEYTFVKKLDLVKAGTKR